MSVLINAYSLNVPLPRLLFASGERHSRFPLFIAFRTENRLPLFLESP